MNLVFNELPKAIRWSRIVAIFLLIFLIFQVLGLMALISGPYAFSAINMVNIVFMLIMLLISGWLWWLMRGYKVACVRALETQESDDLELAARKQVMIIKLFGFLSLLFLILLLISLAGIVFAMIFAKA